MPESLEPCPFCGGDNLEFAQTIGSGDAVSCLDCNAEGPTGADEAEAARLWNHRYGVPDDRNADE